MFKSWNIVDSGLNANAAGHHFWEAKTLADELVRRGETVRIFSHRNGPAAEQFAGAQVIPTFSLFLYNKISKDPVWSTIENFVVHNRTFLQELSSLDPSSFRDSLTLCTTIGENHLLAIFRWLETFPAGARPKVAVCLRTPSEWSKTNRSANFYRTLWKECPADIKKQVALFARTPQNAQMFETHAGMPARVFPYPTPKDLLAMRPDAAPASNGAMVVSFVGGARRERGGALIADVVRQCAGSGVQFVVQVRGGEDSGLDARALASALSNQPHVRLLDGLLEREDYYRSIAGSVVLLAYQPNLYRWRDSGVYNEAKLLDAPSLVSAGTWMGDEVAALGNGLVIKEFSAAAIVDCILQAQRELPALRAATARVGQNYREKHGVERCIAAVANAF